MNNPAPKVGIVVLNWNGASDTIECLISLNRITYPNAEILVVDNGSTDDSRRNIKARFPDQPILELEKNLLFAGGNNAATNTLKERGCEFVIYLNNDTLVLADFLEPLVEWFTSHPGAGIVAPRIFYYHDKRIWFDGGRVSMWTGEVAHTGLRKVPQELDPDPHMTQYITGCCLMMPMKLVDQTQGFDEAFQMYAEDVDLSLRVRNLGLELWVVPASRIFHKVSVSMGGAFSLRKMKRKLHSLFKLFIRHARWYQWPSIIISQPWVYFKAAVRLAGARGSRRYR